MGKSQRARVEVLLAVAPEDDHKWQAYLWPLIFDYS